MAKYVAQADIIYTMNVEAEGEGDPEAIEAAKVDLLSKISSGVIDLTDASFIQDVRIYNLRRAE